VPRAVQLISRLSVGGSVLQAINTTAFLRDRGWDTILVHGEPGPGEGTMQGLADELGIERVILPSLTRDLGPKDARSILACRRELRRLRPQVVHTHGAKAGAVGRVAARLVRTPAVVHTFHGHVLAGYFGPAKERAFRLIERGLSHACDRIIAVSDEVRDDLIELRIANPSKIEVIGVGFDMARFDQHVRAPEASRPLNVTFVGRIVPIKRVDRFLDLAAALQDTDATFTIVGDGEAAPALRASPLARRLGDRLVFAGYRDDIAAVYRESDIVVLTSDNEGTPVSLIEAAASGLPVVGTDVGGVRSVVVDDETGYLVAPDDAAGLAAAVRRLIDDPALRHRLGAAGRERVVARFSADRLATEHDALYRRLLGT
jgi:glycosyltransferase involved in cell wall biosynthesis